ncbi:MAG: phospho-N-acetylmuramoyl-pentapeptide-transferase [Acutalibacteraceae bacterium]|jgi:phospho-N-acetylmuramoyl-pentapeptide-transferase
MNLATVLTLSLTGLGAFLIAALIGRWMIPVLHKWKFGQTIRDIGPSWHKNKQGTPTMGGLIFIAAWVLALVAGSVALALIGAASMTQWLRTYGSPLLLALGCGAIGFADDYIKVIKKRNLGLTGRQKLLAQLLVAAAYAAALFAEHGGSPQMLVPFVGRVDLGLWIVPIVIFVVVGTTNATNLTDGVDGLCGSVTFVAALFFVAVGCVGYQWGLVSYGLIAAALAGALAGFLLYNLHPARVFMGDTGSLFIGGVLCALAFEMEIPLLLIPVGIVYIAETLSVMLQVSYFKLTHGKRLFKMSPLHHHFELSGWSENKIVGVFSFLTLIGGAAALLLYVYA